MQTADAQPMRHLLQATNSELSAAPPTVLTPTPTELMDWAERQYGAYFPPHQADLVWAPYVYRHYPTTGNYVGVAKGRVYIMGPVSGGPLADVGELTDFSASVFATVQAFDDAQAARFLAQATLGYTDADIVDVRSMAFEPWLAREFDKPLSSGNWAWLVAKGVDLDPQAVAIATYVDEQIWQRLLSANDGLRQRVALALSEIFVVGFDGISGPYKQFRLAAWWDLLAEHALGNYRDLLEAVTLNPAMGSYLNTAGNQKEDPSTGRLPDENYAREVMQLFTIGLHELELDGTVRRDANGEPIETYTQDMVSQLARAFTGWNLDRPRGETGPEFVRRPMTLNPALHSTLGVSFLGQTIPAGTDGVAALKIVLDTWLATPMSAPSSAGS